MLRKLTLDEAIKELERLVPWKPGEFFIEVDVERIIEPEKSVQVGRRMRRWIEKMHWMEKITHPEKPISVEVPVTRTMRVLIKDETRTAIMAIWGSVYQENLKIFREKIPQRIRVIKPVLPAPDYRDPKSHYYCDIWAHERITRIEDISDKNN